MLKVEVTDALVENAKVETKMDEELLKIISDSCIGLNEL